MYPPGSSVSDSRIRSGVDPIALIKRYYSPDEKAYLILVEHGRKVAEKALSVARRITESSPDMIFIWEAAMLHDIGMIQTQAHALGCFGEHPYLRHGVIGRQMLEAEGLPRHARVCERHVGVGISEDDIRFQGLSLPCRSMMPETIEEILICYADKFFSKVGNGVRNSPGSETAVEKNIDTILSELEPLGVDKVARFKEWVRRFEKQ